VKSLARRTVHILLPSKTWKGDLYDGEWSIIGDSLAHLLDLGLQVKFFCQYTPELGECDVLCLSSRCFDLTAPSKEWQEQLTKFRVSKPYVIWFDMRDSAGTTQFEVMPYVDRYVKKQIYRNFDFYFDPPYGGRGYTRYYYEKYGVEDRSPYEMAPLLRDDKQKITLGWNIGASSYLSPSRRNRTQFGKVKRRIAIEATAVGFLRRKPPALWGVSPDCQRPTDIFAVLGTNYDRESVAYQRCLLLSQLGLRESQNDFIGGWLSAPQFQRYLQQSKIVVSAFGWGEVCYREFEATWAGAAFAMPDMSGITTWPDIYCENETYIPLPWHFDNVNEILDDALANPTMLRNIAKAAQERLVGIRDASTLKEFALRFTNMCQASS